MAKLVETTYGDALFELAISESSVDSLYAEAQAVIEAFEQNKELGRLLNHPKIEKEEKEQVIKNVFEKFVSKNMTGFLVIMISKDRQKKIVGTLKAFEKRVKEYKKIGTAYVSTAKPLTDAQKDKVVARLSATTEYAAFEMNYIVDESLIGGMVIRIGDRVVDSSIKHKIDELAKDLKKIQLA
ncbi:MAG: ATP synthase F1 subunit delta [Eubacteriales bacterium]|nr:ATP synthase F1 subunit delta [Eubacteriales bacterium]